MTLEELFGESESDGDGQLGGGSCQHDADNGAPDGDKRQAEDDNSQSDRTDSKDD